MFYKMIERARNRWYASADCTIQSLIEYMTGQGNLRDAQIDAIKTYLFLKIGCGNKPLAVLFSSGKFNSLNLDDLEISNKVREYFCSNRAAAAFFCPHGIVDSSVVRRIFGEMMAAAAVA